MKLKLFNFPFGIMPKVLIILLALSLIPLMIVGYSTIRDTIRLGKKIVMDNRDLGVFVSKNSAQALENQAGIYLQQMANDKAKQINMFFEDIQKSAMIAVDFTKGVFSDPAKFGRIETFPWTYTARDGEMSKDITIDSSLETGYTYVDLNDAVSETIRKTEFLGLVFKPIAARSTEINFIYFGTEDGVFRLCPRDEMPLNFDPRLRPWYRSALERRKVSWSEPYIDAAEDQVNLIVTCSAPVFSDNGRPIGVIGIDVKIDTLKDIVSSLVGEDSYAFLIGGLGLTIVHPNLKPASGAQWTDDIFKQPIASLETSDPQFRVIVDKMVSGESGYGKYSDDKGEKYIAYAPIESTNWSIGVGTSAKKIIQPLLASREKIRSEVIKTGDMVRLQVKNFWKNVIIICIILTLFISIVAILLSRSITKPIYVLSNAAKLIGEGHLDKLVEVRSKDEIGVLSEAFNKMVQGLKEREMITKTFGKYVSPEVADMILKNPEKVSLKGARKELTILFSDIRGFTQLADSIEPENLVALLNEYLSEMTKIIMKYKGTIDKFIGDAIMVFWGDPIYYEDHAVKAVRASLEMKESLRLLQKKWFEEGQRSLSMGIGINTGYVTVGNMGSDVRMDYTVLGSNVNLASRINAKAGSDQILITSRTYGLVKDVVEAKKLDPVELKGIKDPVEVYEVVGLK
ncbi:MAG: HAMP domain-containing protein [Candidatus Omnitrophica bacterium]|nr:HAMP domain-containing protein [Candidatus Omnitrophota bacterium]